MNLELDSVAFSVPAIELSVRVSLIGAILAVGDLARSCAGRVCSRVGEGVRGKNLSPKIPFGLDLVAAVPVPLAPSSMN